MSMRNRSKPAMRLHVFGSAALHAAREPVPILAPAGRIVGWLAVFGALAATFWLYTRPNLLIDIGNLMAMCGFS